MALGRWQATIVDEEGNVLPGAQITVRRESAGAPLASIRSDRDGLVNPGNPFNADGNGFAAFHAVGGAYRIDAVLGGSTMTWRYVPIGLAAEADAVLLDISYLFTDSVTDADPGDGTFSFNNATLGSVTQVFIDNVDDVGSDVTTWLDRLDDFGSAADRGALHIRELDGSAEFIARVTGSIVNGTGYRKISVTPLGTAGTFVAGTRVGIAYTPRGADGANGTGDVNGPAGAGAGNVAVFGSGTGKLLADSGMPLVGKQTLYIPARGMVPSSVNGAAYNEAVYGSFTLGTMDFDGTTGESVNFDFKAPKGWDEGVITFETVWFHGLTTTNFGVSWKLSGLALSNGSNLGGTPGTEIEVASTGGVQNELVHSGESGPLTLGDMSPPIMNGDTIILSLRRDPADAQDNLAIDAKLLGVAIYYNTSRNTDD